MYSAYALSNTIIDIASEKLSKKITLNSLQKVMFAVCSSYQTLTNKPLIDDFFTENRVISIDHKFGLTHNQPLPLITIQNKEEEKTYIIGKKDKLIRDLILINLKIFFHSKS